MSTTREAAQSNGPAEAESGTTRPRRGLVIGAAMVVLAIAAALAFVVLRPSTPATDSPEAGFSRDMQRHHAQAVEMALIIRDKTTDRDLRQVAYDIATGQQQQIGQMYAWLQMWGLPQSGQGSMAWMDDSGMKMSGSSMQMPGMASETDLARLRKLAGEQAEVLFLQLMIAHHRGGIQMAEAALKVVDEPVVRRLANAIRVSQAAEIKAMQDMLAARGAKEKSS